MITDNPLLEETQANVFVLKACLEKEDRFRPAHFVSLKKLILEMVDNEWPGGFITKQFTPDHSLLLVHSDGRMEHVTGVLTEKTKPKIMQILEGF